MADDTTRWQFDREHVSPIGASRDSLHYIGSGTELLTRPSAADFVGDDFTRPTGPVGSTRFLDRAGFTVELAPPPHKPHPLQLVVDAETGIVLQQRNDGFATVDEWVEFVTGEVLDPALFTWTGPTRSRADQRAVWAAEHEAEMARRREWFAANVVPSPLRVELDVVPFVHEYDDATGAFQASLGDHFVGMLARRPRADAPWDLGWSEPGHRWSAARWDWALMALPDLTPAGLDELKRQLDAADG